MFTDAQLILLNSSFKSSNTGLRALQGSHVGDEKTIALILVL
mgnify:CR=1 FL=1